MKYSIIVTGYNCEKYADECLESVLNQSYANWECLVWNDASTDDTANVLKKYDGTKIKVFNQTENEGALKGRYELIREATGDVVCFLGLDDKLTPNALEILNGYYTDEVKLTWGNWMNTRGYRFPVKNYDTDVWENKSFRRAAWRATALNTFRRDLILQVPKDVLLMDGKWIDNCTDLAYSFPCLEMVERNEVRVVLEPIYIYRDNHGNTTRNRLGKAHKAKIREYLKRL